MGESTSSLKKIMWKPPTKKLNGKPCWEETNRIILKEIVVNVRNWAN